MGRLRPRSRCRGRRAATHRRHHGPQGRLKTLPVRRAQNRHPRSATRYPLPPHPHQANRPEAAEQTNSHPAANPATHRKTAARRSRRCAPVELPRLVLTLPDQRWTCEAKSLDHYYCMNQAVKNTCCAAVGLSSFEDPPKCSDRFCPSTSGLTSSLYSVSSARERCPATTTQSLLMSALIAEMPRTRLRLRTATGVGNEAVRRHVLALVNVH